ncbi:MAG: hypothetical protein DDT22_01134 [candidate division WS2 bacterium]|nr:hypothetical protein [Candidatus Lithacetigena glycinireducens]
MSLEGSLKSFGLEELIGMLSWGKKTGRLVLKTDNEVGEIFLKGGVPIHALVGQIKGEDALFHVFLWMDGNFSFDTDVPSSVESINLPIDMIIKEAGERKRRWQEVQVRIPSFDVTLEPITQLEKDHVVLSADEWIILPMIFNRMTIKNIILTSPLGSYRSMMAINSLIEQGVFSIGQRTVGEVFHELITELKPEGIISTSSTEESAFVSLPLIKKLQDKGWFPSENFKVEIEATPGKTVSMMMKGRVGLKDDRIQLPAAVLSRLGIKPGDKVKISPSA